MRRDNKVSVNVKAITDEKVNMQKGTVAFLKHCKLKGLSIDTIKFYDKELKQVRKAFFEIHVPLHDVSSVTNTHIEQFIEHMQALGRKVSTINARLRAMHTFYNFCVEKGYTVKNPCEGIPQLKQRHKVGATFTKSQLKKLLEAPNVHTFTGLRDLAIMTTFAHTGIRLSELSAIRLQDITFEGKGALIVQRAKNRYARRIPLTKRLKAILHAYIEERGSLDTDILFVNLEGTQISQRTIQERLKYYGEQTGVQNFVNVSPHAFRRTFCKLKVQAGTDIFVLQRLTGHSSLEILQRYVLIYGKDLEEAIERGI
ncbi:UNVERIFIED_ORG: integrase/recombinase XerD [Heyndrickxia coagulans]